MKFYLTLNKSGPAKTGPAGPAPMPMISAQPNCKDSQKWNPYVMWASLYIRVLHKGKNHLYNH